MKIVICASISATPRIKEIADSLVSQGHQVEIPLYSQKILAGEISLADFSAVKESQGDFMYRIKAEEDLIRRYYNLIKAAEAIVVVNIEKNGQPNYIGGNTFLEMGFAHVLNKKIFLLNPIPESTYRDELLAMQPVILNNDLSKIS